MTRPVRLESALLGAMIGGAIGDALGMPLEGLTANEIRFKYGHVQYYLKGRADTPTRDLKPGQVTDDTQLVMATLRALVHYNGYRTSNLAYEFRSLESNLRGAGKSTYCAINKLVKGVPPEECGDPAGVGCGAITRVAPLAFYFRNTLDPAAEEEIIKAVRLTHNNVTAEHAALLVVGIIEQLYDHVPLCLMQERKRFLGDIEKAIYVQSEQLALLKENITRVSEMLKVSEKQAVQKLGTSGSIMDVLPAALYSFLKSPKQYQDSVLRAVNMGGDTDSIASLTGTFSGLYNGVECIPSYFVQGLECREELTKLTSILCERLRRRFR